MVLLAWLSLAVEVFSGNPLGKLRWEEQTTATFERCQVSCGLWREYRDCLQATGQGMCGATTDNKIRVLNPSGQEREGEGVRQSATTVLGHCEELWLGDSGD